MTATDSASQRDPGDAPGRSHHVRAAATPEDRRRVLRTLFPARGEGSTLRFALLMAFSVVIAVMGLSANSAAVVIGAMLIAPLMTPVLGLAAALVVALGRHVARAAATVVAGSAGAVALAWAIALLLPRSERVLTGEVLSRTSPDLRDLFVALAAGAAGAYATARQDLSAALPGVAVAVALVPPLATVGFTLAAGRRDLAGGALLLFAANLVAIVLAGVVTFLVTGLAPRRRLVERSRWILAATAAVAGAVALIAVPLAGRSATAIRHAHRTQQIDTAVAAWLSSTDLSLSGVTMTGDLVAVDVTGAQPPPDTEPLRRALVAYLGSSAAVRVRWFQSGTATMAAPPGPTSTTMPVKPGELRPVVQAWLATSPSGADSFNIVGISAADGQVTVKISGPLAPPPAADLATRIATRLGRPEKVKVDWTQTAGSTADVAVAVRAAVTAWLATHPDIVLLDVTAAGHTVNIDLAGEQPPDTTALLSQTRTAAGGATVQIRFVPLQVLKPPRPPAG